MMSPTSDEEPMLENRLSREDTLKHFPPDFDCSQLLFASEKIVWLQQVPPHKRLLRGAMAKAVLRHLGCVTIAIFLAIIGFRLSIHTAVADHFVVSVRTEYLTACIMFLILEVVMFQREFGGTRVDIATNLRIVRATIFRTDVYVDTISYRCIDKAIRGATYLEFILKRNTSSKTSWFTSVFVPPRKSVLSYIPPENAWIVNNYSALMASAPEEAAAIAASEDAIQKLEDGTPSKNIQVPAVYSNLVLSNNNHEDDILWKYMPSPFEKRRALTIQLLFMSVYFLVATLCLVLPVVYIMSEYPPMMWTMIVFWILYCVVIILTDTEFNEMITLNATGIASFTNRLSVGGRLGAQCGSRVTRLNYKNVYPLYSFIYRTPNSTPTEYKFNRALQAILARIFAYTDGSGGIQFPNNVTIRVPNVLDLEWAILQKHYQSAEDATDVELRVVSS